MAEPPNSPPGEDIATNQGSSLPNGPSFASNPSFASGEPSGSTLNAEAPPFAPSFASGGAAPSTANVPAVRPNSPPFPGLLSPGTSVSSAWSPDSAMTHARTPATAGRLFLNVNAANGVNSPPNTVTISGDVFHDVDNNFDGNSPRSSASDGEARAETDLASGLIGWDGELFEEDIWVVAIPEDVLYHIFSFVHKSQLPTLQLVCKEWKRVSDEPKLWKDIRVKPSYKNLAHATRSISTRFAKGVASLSFRGCKTLSPNDLACLASLPYLKTLNLRECALTDQCAPFVAGCTGLQNLSLKMCHHLSDTTVAQISMACTDLRAVDLSGCAKLTDASMIALSALPLLSCLKLKWCSGITDNGLRELAHHAKELQVLNLRKCQEITNTGLSHLSACPKLSALNLRKVVKVTDDGIYELVAGPDRLAQSRLSSVKLRGCKLLTSKALEHLANRCEDLKNVDMSKCRRVTDEGVAQLMKCPNLTDMNFTKCPNIGDGALISMGGAISRNIRDVVLDGCKKITDEGVMSLSSDQCPNLRAFRVAFCEQLTDASMLHLADNFPNLKLLYLHGCTNLTDQSVEYLSSIPKLQALSVRGCTKITDTGMRSLSKLSNMHSLDICELKEVTDEGIGHLSNLPHLRLLIMKRCRVTDKTAEHLAQFPRLMIVNIRQCETISNAALAKLQATRPKLQIRRVTEGAGAAEDDVAETNLDHVEASPPPQGNRSPPGSARGRFSLLGTVKNAFMGLLISRNRGDSSGGNGQQDGSDTGPSGQENTDGDGEPSEGRGPPGARGPGMPEGWTG